MKRNESTTRTTTSKIKGESNEIEESHKKKKSLFLTLYLFEVN